MTKSERGDWWLRVRGCLERNSGSVRGQGGEKAKLGTTALM